MHARFNNKILELPDNASLSTKYLKWSLEKQRLMLWYLKQWSAFTFYEKVFEISDNPTLSLCQLLLKEREFLYSWNSNFSEDYKIQMYLISKAARHGYGYYEACRGELARNIRNNNLDFISYVYNPVMEQERHGYYVDSHKPLPVEIYQFHDYFGFRPEMDDKTLFFIEGQLELAFSLVDADVNFLFCDVYDKGDVEEKYFYEQLANYLDSFNNAKENAKVKRDYYVRYDTYDDINKEFALLELKKYGTRR